MIYFDNAATTFPKPDIVYDTVNIIQRTKAVNIGRGSYRTASEAMSIVDETRLLMAKLFGASNPNKVIFTPSATIAANEIIGGLEWDRFKTVYVSPFEHNAIARPLNLISNKYGIEIRLIPFDPKTQEWDKEKTERLFALNPPDYIFLNHVSNVTGLILPVENISELAKAYGSIVIVDGSQSAGLLEIDLQKLGADFFIFAGHKNLYASWGIGGFIINSDISLKHIISGGTGSDSLNLEMSSEVPIGFEPGSPNIIAISSLNASLKWLNGVGVDNIKKKKAELMKRLIAGLRKDGAELYLPKNTKNHTSVLSFNIEGYLANEIGTILGEDFDIAVRTGYHCAPFVHKLLGTESTGGTVRASLGYFTSEDDIDYFVRALSEI